MASWKKQDEVLGEQTTHMCTKSARSKECASGVLQKAKQFVSKFETVDNL